MVYTAALAAVFILRLLMNYLMKNYKPIDISFDYGKGCYLYTHKKEKYLDALSGIGVCCIGHAHNEVTKVINDQAKKLIHVSNLFNIILLLDSGSLLENKTSHEPFETSHISFLSLCL